MAIRMNSPSRLRLRSGRMGLTRSSDGTPALSLTLVDFAKDYQPFQRVGTSKNIPVVANFTGSPTALQARAINDADSSPVTAWTTFAFTPTGGVASGVLNVPQGLRFCRLEVRDSVNTELVSSGTKRFAVAECGVLWGQSNMFNRKAGVFGYPLGSRYIREYESNVFRRFGNINDALPPGTVTPNYPSFTVSGGSQGDAMVFFADILVAGLMVPVYLLNRAVGGSAIESWIEDGNPGVNNNWDTCKAEIAAAFPGSDFAFALGQIGETNASSTSKAAMKTKFGTVHAQFKALTGRSDANFKFGLTSLGPGSYLSSVEGQFGAMRAAVVEYCTGTPGAFYATGGHDTRTGVDSVHINGEGFGYMGRREAKSYLYQLGIGANGAGPHITGASRSGTFVTINIALAAGTALVDGAGGTGGALTGFQFFDVGAGNAPITYSATSIVGNTVVVTLDSVPVGQLLLNYAMMNVPHGTAANPQSLVRASCVYDNSPIFGSTVGSPLQPIDTFPVT